MRVEWQGQCQMRSRYATTRRIPRSSTRRAAIIQTTTRKLCLTFIHFVHPPCGRYLCKYPRCDLANDNFLEHVFPRREFSEIKGRYSSSLARYSLAWLHSECSYASSERRGTIARDSWLDDLRNITPVIDVTNFAVTTRCR